jgi:meso-butanediol dehydrogenase / (S,S)-butanediol dehydrogenase / diacetyl reductase
VVVTGGNKGIGLSHSPNASRPKGANIVIASVEPQVEEAAARLRERGTACGVLCDVTDKGAVVALYDRAEAEFGGVDISVQNAGIITIAKVEDLTEQEWDATMAVNTKGAFLCCQEAIRRMRKGGRGGRLVNIASGRRATVSSTRPHYAASKFGVMGMTQSLAKEVALDASP